MGMLVLFWYCYDDFLAGLLDMPALGEVPFVWWLLFFGLACLESASQRARSSGY